ncbi:hypothetical protein [Rhizobium sp. HT1-10]|uniref:hypothetical protein n=1 Tax=Rhizobium sp. HT1-10 TaxID=3111638 RepID=UPI003C19C0A8
MKIRTAGLLDIGAMSTMLELLVAAGRRTAPADVEYVREHYVRNPLGIRRATSVE